MPTLIIDDIPVEVPEGTNLLEAARSIGITIPHFCWHPALGKAGACRACAVKVLGGPAKGIQMSCMLPAQDGMVVSTSDEEAVSLRKSVIEWLMINHPHDCPVCDEGGECQLQDFTIAGGHGIRRYDGLKRTHTNQYLGEQIEHEMNRCIQCYRCARYYQEYAGGSDFGVMGRAGSVYFGRHQDGPLESPFSGNLVDICPTGVFTDRTARFRARYWDYDMAPSVCPHCSLGCNTIPMARYRELLKVTARRNDAVNGWFICDRGRFSHATVNAPDRPRQAMVDGKPVALDAALDALADRIEGFLELHGPRSLAIVGSPRMSQEGNIMAARLANLLGAGTLSFFSDERQAAYHQAALDQKTASQHDVRSADLIVIMGCDLLTDAPMLALATRQAWRDNARVFMVPDQTRNKESDRNYPASLPFDCTFVSSLAEVPLSGATNPVLICGIDTPNQSQTNSDMKSVFVMDGPNACGCALLAWEHGAVALSEALARGAVKGLISFEADLPAQQMLGVTVLAAVDWLNNPAVRQAEIFLPCTAWVEQDGAFINYEGRAQKFSQVMKPGLPIKGLTAELHPPRIHRHAAPGGDCAPSWQIISTLMERLGEQHPETPQSRKWSCLSALAPESEGALIHTPEEPK